MNEREREVLIELEACPRCGMEWARPMDVGGSDQSHHSATLRRLVARGWVATRQYGGEPASGPGAWEKTKRGRGSRLYRITVTGRAALKTARAAQ